MGGLNYPAVVAQLPLVAVACFVEWGLVQIYLGLRCLKAAIQDDAGAAFAGILSGSTKQELDGFTSVTWPKNIDRVLAHHALNTIMVGLWALGSCVCVVYKWRVAAVIALVQYGFSWGSLLSIDTAQIGSTIASQQPFICAIGYIATGLTVALEHPDVLGVERIGAAALGAVLAGATIANKILNPKDEEVPKKRD